MRHDLTRRDAAPRPSQFCENSVSKHGAGNSILLMECQAGASNWIEAVIGRYIFKFGRGAV